MLAKYLSGAILAAVMGVASVQAQSVGDIGGPSNLPPSGWNGQQFVDNRGCVFLKAGNGGQTMWVPRVSRDHKAMCGFPPSFGAKPKIEVASDAEAEGNSPTVMAAAAPVVVPEVVAKPAPVVVAAKPRVASVPVESYVPAPVTELVPVVVRPAPYADAAPRGSYERAASGGSAGKIGCYSSAPVAERVKLRNGGTAVVCTRGDGTMTGWRPPIYPDGARVGASLSDPVLAGDAGTRSGSRRATSGDNGYVQTYADASDAARAVPKGYKLAWNDDRLNPNRGKGTLAGWQDQNEVWTLKVPATLVADEPAPQRKKKVVYVQRSTGVVISTKSEPTAVVKPKVQAKVKATKGGAYIQVGTFGVPANAEGAAARLSGLGLPVARGKITSSGKPMTIVLAGPFGSAADAQAALAMARGAGFGDAFIR